MITQQSIAELAYRLWTARGSPGGSPDQDWLEAERQLLRNAPPDAADDARQEAVDTSVEESFPASDAPASHIPDKPPINAAEKWISAGKEPPQAASPKRPSLGK